MTNPEETPAQAIERLRREISQLRRLRGQMPMLILEPYVEEAASHIREVAARLSVKATVPALTAITASRETQIEETRPPPPPEVPPVELPPGTRVTYMPQKLRSLVLYHMPTGKLSSPPEWETVILTEDGRILTVPPAELAPEAAGPAIAAAAPRLSPGARVRVKTTGKTGYVSEVAGESAVVALDEGGFITVPIADLEPLASV